MMEILLEVQHLTIAYPQNRGSGPGTESLPEKGRKIGNRGRIRSWKNNAGHGACGHK